MTPVELVCVYGVKEELRFIVFLYIYLVVLATFLEDYPFPNESHWPSEKFNHTKVGLFLVFIVYLFC